MNIEQIDVQIVGEGANLVVLHSLLTDRSSFGQLAIRLSDQKRLILVYLPGFGASARAEPLDGYAERIAELFENLRLPPGTDGMGNGLGSFVALKMAARHGAMLGRMVLLGAAIAFPEAGRQTFRALADKVDREGMEAVAAVAMARMFPEDFIAANSTVVADRKAVFGSINPAVFAAAARALASLDLTSELDHIRNPVLVVVGENDGATPPALGRELASRLTDGRVIELAGIGHAPHIQAPDLLANAILPFLRPR
jgi:3-oxoadipate enol-lactonase